MGHLTLSNPALNWKSLQGAVLTHLVALRERESQESERERERRKSLNKDARSMSSPLAAPEDRSVFDNFLDQRETEMREQLA